MEIAKQYHAKINTAGVASADNISTGTRTRSPAVKDANLALHSLEVLTEVPTD